jgi:hypothetical protein
MKVAHARVGDNRTANNVVVLIAFAMGDKSRRIGADKEIKGLRRTEFV